MQFEGRFPIRDRAKRSATAAIFCRSGRGTPECQSAYGFASDARTQSCEAEPGGRDRFRRRRNPQGERSESTIPAVPERAVPAEGSAGSILREALCDCGNSLPLWGGRPKANRHPDLQATHAPGRRNPAAGCDCSAHHQAGHRTRQRHPGYHILGSQSRAPISGEITNRLGRGCLPHARTIYHSQRGGTRPSASWPQSARHGSPVPPRNGG